MKIDVTLRRRPHWNTRLLTASSIELHVRSAQLGSFKTPGCSHRVRLDRGKLLSVTETEFTDLNLLFVAVPAKLATSWQTQIEARQTCDVRSSGDLSEAASVLRAAKWFPDLVVVYQGIPDQFAVADVEAFVGLLPMTRCVVVFGPWCESIGRTEQCWPIGWCVPLQHAQARLAQFGFQ